MVTDEQNGWRTRPTYTIGQAAKLAGTSPANVRRWLYGYQAPGHKMRPVFGRRAKDKDGPVEVSFLELAEIVVVRAFRRKGVTLERLRRAHAFAREQLGMSHPFASLKLRTDGVHVLHEFEESEPGASLLVLDKYGQWTLPGAVVRTLEEFDFEADLAARWFPKGHDIPIVIDPRFAAGKPTVAGSGVTIETIYKRWKSGEKIDFIAEDYELDEEVVKKALQHADKLAA